MSELHDERDEADEAVAHCVECGRPVCEDCLVESGRCWDCDAAYSSMWRWIRERLDERRWQPESNEQ